MKRKQYLPWLIAVFGIFGTVYGAYLVPYHFKHSNKLSVWSLVLLILGVIALGFTIALEVSLWLAKKKKESNSSIEEKAVVVEEKPVEEEKIEPVKKVESKQKEVTASSPRERLSYSVYSSSRASTVYVKQMGYGPLLRIEGDRILDMRNNTYYRFENNLLMQEGYGPVFEIRGNQIRSAFGGYLYELSGSNINKVFGGFYASISGNYITLFDASIKYEVTDSLSKRQILAVAALLFGKY